MQRAEWVELIGLLIAVAGFILLVGGLWSLSPSAAVTVVGLMAILIGGLTVRKAQRIDGDA